MKSLSKVFPIFALTGLLMLAGCASDELPSNGSGPGTTVPPIGTTTESGTVKFTNNTAMTIGSSQETAMTRATTFDNYSNDACALNFDEPFQQPTTEEVGKIVENQTQSFSQFISGKGMAVGTGGIFKIRDNTDDIIDIEKNVYILKGGTANIYKAGNSPGPVVCTGGAKIIIEEGGTLNLQDDVEISDLTILNYGGTINIEKKLTINNGATLKTNTDLNIKNDESLEVQGNLYVGGSLNCETSLTMGSYTKIHVIGDFNYSGAQPLTISLPAKICVEEKMSVTNDMIVDCGANIHANCSLEVTGKLTLTNGATLCATHIEAATTDLTNDNNTSTATTKIYLTDGGVAELGDLILGNNVLFNKANYDGTKALIDCNELTLPKADISGIIGNSFYLTYEELTGSYTTESDITFADNSLINVAAVNENSTDDCNPGYSLTDIIIPLPDDIVSGFGSYILDADDFSIRINGDYIEDITVEGNAASLDGIVVTDNNTLNITLSGIINNENIKEGNDYTYEVYIWIRNVNPTPEAGTGAYLPLFGTEDYMRWIGMTDEEIAKAELPLSPDVNTGVDVTNEDIQASNLKVQSPAGYFVRYNIHRGLQGKIDSTTGLGDTPYIKVSIHIQKDPTMPANSAILIYSSDKKE